MCDIGDCPDERRMYRPIDEVPSAEGQLVRCQQSVRSRCITSGTNSEPASSGSSPSSASSSGTSSSSETSSSSIIDSSPSPSPTPSSAPSSTPPSVVGQTSPIVSGPTSAPSASAPALPSPSTSPSQNVTAVTRIVSAGEACDQNNPCESGTSCSCRGYCGRNVELIITAIATDEITPMVCDSPLTPSPSTNEPQQTWTYNGPCTGMFFKIKQSGSNASPGVAAAISKDKGASWHSTSFPQHDNPSGIKNAVAKSNPNGLNFLKNKGYDFSGWGQVSESQELSASPGFKNFMDKYNARVWTHNEPNNENQGNSGNNGNSGNSFTWFKVDPPNCLGWFLVNLSSHRSPHHRSPLANRTYCNLGLLIDADLEFGLKSMRNMSYNHSYTCITRIIDLAK